jgi:integrase
MKAHGLLERIGRGYRHRLTDKGTKAALMFILFHKRVCGPLANSLFSSWARRGAHLRLRRERAAFIEAQIGPAWSGAIMRPSEYLALKWPDVSFSKGTVSIARTLEPIKGGGWRFADTKRARSRRLVKLQASVLKLLADYRDVEVWERDPGNGDVAAADLIFVNSNGKDSNSRSDSSKGR